MKPIDGLDLTKIAEQAEKERIDEQASLVRRKITMVIGRSAEARGSILNLEKQLLKARERLGKEQAKLDAIQRGDWSVLEDEKDKNVEQEKGEQPPQQRQEK